MKICGLKLTHDGAVALIEDNKLIFCVEMEKRNNNPRYSGIEDTNAIADILQEHGYAPSDVDVWAIDGWGGYDEEALALQPRLEVGSESNKLSVDHDGMPGQINIAQYQERTPAHDIMEEWQYKGLPVNGKEYDYSSYLHVTGHVMSAYATSPFADKGESSYILIWDGGMYPRLYYFDADTKKVENLGPLFLLIGNIYTIFSQHFGPFKVAGGFAKDNLSTAGKVMAYIAKGKCRKELFPLFDEIYREHYDKPMGFANLFANEFSRKVQGKGYTDEDILATFHDYMEQLLIEKLLKKVQRKPKPSKNLCMAGGCALNIKWNSAIRNTGYFSDVYVPPFPNDSGSALGAACAAMLNHTGHAALQWSVYSGPAIQAGTAATGWEAKPCSPRQLAELLHTTNLPVVFLNGRAELGPRALGNRSILAAPVTSWMKEELNRAKRREAYRPVSPICLEDQAEAIFDPGTSDPYMLFDHMVRPGWEEKIPAVIHLDGSARLQTMSEAYNEVVTSLLKAYYEISGIPMLCNTSANYNGTGFFPDVASATAWGAENQVHYVWCQDTLYTHTEALANSETGEARQTALV
ncbi:carbamoyltransferase N-terminal domain-containing protein [Roseivirga sp. BDSF3-8]|uniref:carbamoyltransferase N-terminal domain-containing protein n=1 Tax=Roseivirga sp. BDSF3-8 TaxID=3241598 RepID=UPI003531B57C